MSFDPSQDSMRLYSQIVFRLLLEGSGLSPSQAQGQQDASPIFDELLSHRVINYNLGKSAYVNVKVSPGYLIITADAFSNAIQPFVSLKRAQGFTVVMTSLSQIPGGTSKEDIKSYIQTAYHTWMPDYLLLVGDTDTIPAWPGQSEGVRG